MSPTRAERRRTPRSNLADLCRVTLVLSLLCSQGCGATSSSTQDGESGAGTTASTSGDSGGVSGTVGTSSGGGTTAGVSGECPRLDPSYGACDEMGARCEYTDDRGCPVALNCSATPTLIWFPSHPAGGKSCDNPGQICDYTLCDVGCSFSALECVDDTWRTADLCPPEPPDDGEPCEGDSLICRYSSCDAGMETVSTALCGDCTSDAAAEELCFTVTSGIREGEACVD